MFPCRYGRRNSIHLFATHTCVCVVLGVVCWFRTWVVDAGILFLCLYRLTFTVVSLHLFVWVGVCGVLGGKSSAY